MNTGLKMALMRDKTQHNDDREHERGYDGGNGMHYPVPWPPYGGDPGREMNDRDRMPVEGRRYRDERGRYTDRPTRRRAEHEDDRGMRYGEYENGPEMRRIGFERDPWEMGMHYGKSHEMQNDEEYGGNIIPMHRNGEKRGMPQPITRQRAVEWVGMMKSSDPAKPQGGRWSMEEVKPYAQRVGIPTEGQEFFEFFAIMNAMYSDYFEVAKKYNMQNNPAYFADLAKAWLHDEDAVEDKAAMYYECIVKH